MDKPEKVEPGQVWEDNDKRSKTPEFTITSVEVRKGREVAVVERNGKRNTIRTSRLLEINHTRGYTYLGKGR